MRFCVVLTALLLFLSWGTAFGGQTEQGKKLFFDNSLGTNGKNCATCHLDGKGLENAGEYDVEMLQDYVNFCIRDALKGKLLPAGAPQLVALEKYVRSFHKKK